MSAYGIQALDLVEMLKKEEEMLLAVRERKLQVIVFLVRGSSTVSILHQLQ